MRAQILQDMAAIQPFDEIEKEHIEDVTSWVKSGAEIYRIQKPATPNKHLVSYFVLIDLKAEKILLVDHIKSGLWLPTGGHVDIDEHPRETVTRECMEELNIEAVFLETSPIFVTVSETVGITAGHTDVSLWYILSGKEDDTYKFDKSEFEAIKWFHFDGVPFDQTDPNMQRFIQKIRQIVK